MTGNVHINVTMWRVHVPTVVVEEQLVLHIQSVCVRSISYCACIVLYCYPRGLWLYRISSHYIKRAQFSGVGY